MNRSVVVLNAGSSSLKFAAFDVSAAQPNLAVRGQVEGMQTSPRFKAEDRLGKRIAYREWPSGKRLDHQGALDCVASFLRGRSDMDGIAAVGHRVVHGGAEFTQPVLVDAHVIEQLERLVPLAPVHQPHNIEPIHAVAKLFPDLPQVACFDTGFHSGQSEVARAFALPRAISESGVRRYGFHGLSYEYVAGALHETDPRLAASRTIVAHLGSGASMCAMHGGRSVATTMGFTSIDGLPMGTRCGALDAGVVLYLMNELGMSSAAVQKMLYNESGLLGVSGVSSDMRVLLASDEPQARLAVDLFVYRVGRELGSLAAALGGLEALVFTAGIGEHSPEIRRRVCRDAAWLGVELDDDANEAGARQISAKSSRVSVFVIPTDEERVIARYTARAVRPLAASPA
jgi:acetate kinase